MEISAFILAAGVGKRMFPFSKYVPKPMLPILNKPILFHSIERLLDSNISNIGIVVDKTDQIIIQNVKKAFPSLNPQYIFQEEALGTAHAVLQIKKFLATENFVVVAGDSLFSSSFIKQLYETHHKEKNTITLSLEEMEFELMKASSTVDFRNGRIWKILEKPQTPEEILSNLNSSALYVFSKYLFNVIDKIPKSKRNEYELATAINKIIKQNKRVGGVITKRVCHISTPYDLWHFNLQFLHETKKIDNSGNFFGRNITIGESTSIKNSILGDNSIIKEGVTLDNCVVLQNTVVDQSYENSIIQTNYFERFLN